MNGILTNNPQIRLRLMREADLPMLYDWLNREHIVEWWQKKRPSLEEVRAKYLPRILAPEAVTPYIAILDETPFAYVQSYIALGCGNGWWEQETDPGVRGIDQSIADPMLLGKGFGTLLVRTTLRHLFDNPDVTKVQTDPSPENGRAIRCYEKAGFIKIATIETPNGPAIYMVCDRQRHEDLQGAA